MIKTIIFDFSRVILFPKDKSYRGKLNPLYDKVSKQPTFTFIDYFEFNEALLKKLDEIKNKYNLYVFTTGHIQNAPEVTRRIGHIFTRVYSVENIPFDKEDPEGYRFVAKELSLKPEEILYIDDISENVAVAEKAGFHTIVFLENDQLFHDWKTLL